jgi:uncharacterized membrane protein
MGPKAAITINRPPEELERLWREERYRPRHIADMDASVRFMEAPGDRGTEIHVEINSEPRAGRLGEIAQKLTGSEPQAKARDDLRRFKQLVETGEIPRSDSTPEGESLESKLRQRPAQPVSDEEFRKTQEVGV